MWPVQFGGMSEVEGVIEEDTNSVALFEVDEEGPV